MILALRIHYHPGYFISGCRFIFLFLVSFNVKSNYFYGAGYYVLFFGLHVTSSCKVCHLISLGSENFLVDFLLCG